MSKKIRPYIEVLPITLSFVGSIMIAFSLRLIDPADGKGTIEVFGKKLIIPEQIDWLFYLGIIILSIGAIWEIVKIFRQHTTAR